MGEPLAQLRAALSDRYTLERELSAGGMATVYLARDIRSESWLNYADGVVRRSGAQSLHPRDIGRAHRRALHAARRRSQSWIGGALWMRRA